LKHVGVAAATGNAPFWKGLDSPGDMADARPPATGPGWPAPATGCTFSDMARGIGENPVRSPAWHIAQVEYPTTRDELVITAEENEAPVEVINFMKALPKEKYESAEEVLRDFAEAERRFGVGNVADERARRENIGKVAAEDQSKHP
jgi:hypothetical protein